MRAAVDYGVPYITTLQAARAAAQAIDAIKREKITTRADQPLYRDGLNGDCPVR